MKSFVGIPGNDPADSKWLKLDVLDHNTGVREPRGQLCINIQLWPKDKAIVMPVGARRDEPNTNPYLPPPVGRLKWSWNPFVLGSQLCGPWICAQVFCCLISITFVVLMIFVYIYTVMTFFYLQDGMYDYDINAYDSDIVGENNCQSMF